MLLPALNKARQAAKGVECLSNLRQVELAIQMYANDNRQMYPPYVFSWITDYNNGSWAAELVRQGYVKSPRIYHCPSLQTDIDWANPAMWNPDGVAYTWTDYGYNYTFIGSSNGPPTPAKLTQILHPASTIVLADTLYLLAPGVVYRGYYVVYPHWNGGTGALAHARHNGDHAVNIAWADGHASALQVSNSKDPYDSGLTNFYDPTNFWTRNGLKP
jgi:prepilin-type processing-associated H-X9-DG protein